MAQSSPGTPLCTDPLLRPFSVLGCTADLLLGGFKTPGSAGLLIGGWTGRHYLDRELHLWKRAWVRRLHRRCPVCSYRCDHPLVQRRCNSNLTAAGQALKSLLQIPASAAVPSVAAKVGAERLYLLSQCFFCITMLALFLLPPNNRSSAYASVALGASVVIPIAAAQVLPYALLGQLAHDDERVGLLVSGLSQAQLAGVLLCFLCMGPVARLAGWRYVMLMSALLSLCSLVPIAMSLHTPPVIDAEPAEGFVSLEQSSKPSTSLEEQHSNVS